MAQFLQLNTPISQHDWQMVLSDITDHDAKICTEQKSKNTKKLDLVPSGIDVTICRFYVPELYKNRRRRRHLCSRSTFAISLLLRQTLNSFKQDNDVL